ncbi:MAG: hypothetical protein LCH39_15190 [Proteobacteria bacterium]|nr:hypothetical protein [Pseudomonadota bacterium]
MPTSTLETSAERNVFTFALAEALRAREKSRRATAYNLATVMAPREMEADPSLLTVESDVGAFFAAAPAGDACVASDEHLAFVEVCRTREILFFNGIRESCHKAFVSQLDAEEREQVLAEQYKAALEASANLTPNIRQRQYLAEQSVLATLKDFEAEQTLLALRAAFKLARTQGCSPKVMAREILLSLAS